MHPLHEDPNWPRASAWLAGEHLPDPAGSISVLGAQLNCSITPGHCDEAPDAIRAVLKRLSTYDVDSDLDVRRLKVRDLGNIELDTPESAVVPVAKAMQKALDKEDAIVLLGGDNGITRPGVLGLGEPVQNVGLITLDAHFDLRDLDNGLMNGNPVRALLKDGLPGTQIVQIGIQSYANSRAYAELAKQAGIAVVSADRVHRRGLGAVVTEALADLSPRVNAIYVNVDLDVLDRSFAPACPGSRPGGLIPWDLKAAVRLLGLSAKVRAIDFVEIDPTKDIADATCFAAAECLLSFASGVLVRKLAS